MSRIIEALHPGLCPVCEETFTVGTRITKHEGGWGHVQCPERAPRPVCPDCFMERALNGACGCGVL